MKYWKNPKWLYQKKPTWVKVYEKELEEYYEEPVRPVSQYCDAFYVWREQISELYKNSSDDSEFEKHRLNQWGDILKALNTLQIPITKSSYLGRRIYGGERHRTKMCPVHKGVWSGLPFKKEPCGCDLTGWIYEGKDGE